MKRALALLLLGLLLLGLLLLPTPALGQGPLSAEPASQDAAPVVTGAHVDFPHSIAFDLSLEGAGEITRVLFQYQVVRLSTVPVTNIVKPDFTSGPKLEASWTWELARTGSLPPGAEIRYRWLLEDAAGESLETPYENLFFDDDRHQWRSTAEEGITLYWYQGDQPFAQDLLGAALKSRHQLYEATGVYLERPMRVYVYASGPELREAMLFSQGWEGGKAFPTHGIVIMAVAPAELAWGRSTLAHELAHLVVHQMTYNPYGDLPTWLDEGLASYAEGALSPTLREELQKAVARDQLITVSSLSSAFPADPGEAALSYAESYSLVQFLISSYGSERMGELLAVFREGAAYDDALLQVYGLDSRGLNSGWRTSLGLSPQPPPATPPPAPGGRSGTCPASPEVLAVLVVVAFLARRRHA